MRAFYFTTRELESAISQLPEDARAYFERLVQIGRLALMAAFGAKETPLVPRLEPGPVITSQP